MICDGNTCYREYLDTGLYEQSHAYAEDEFIKSLKHEKCKLIQLVRQQMHRFHDTQYSLSSISDESKRIFTLGLQDTTCNINQELSAKEDTNKNAHITPRTLYTTNSMPTRQARLARSLGKIRRRICALVSVAGVIVLVSLIYGVYFRAYLCNNGPSCVTSFRYIHAKHALF